MMEIGMNWMRKEDGDELGGISTQLLFWLLLCPKCVFEVDIRNLGHQMVNYAQKVVCECPNCHKMIIKTAGVDLGVMNSLENSQALQ